MSALTNADPSVLGINVSSVAAGVNAPASQLLPTVTSGPLFAGVNGEALRVRFAATIFVWVFSSLEICYVLPSESHSHRCITSCEDGVTASSLLYVVQVLFIIPAWLNSRMDAVGECIVGVSSLPCLIEIGKCSCHNCWMSVPAGC